MQYLKSEQLRNNKKQNKRGYARSTLPKKSKSRVTKALEFPQNVKDSIKLRDGGCVLCKSPRYKLHCHHFVYRKPHLGMGIIENGVALCLQCHKDVHEHDPNFELRDKLQNYLDTLYPHFTNDMRKYNKNRR